MAGGAGTRFWPESRADRPKQLLCLVGDETMIQRTVERLGSVVPPERVLILTGARLDRTDHASNCRSLPPSAILAEPCKRDTAPCIGLAAFHLTRRDPDATMAVMPSDHVISTDEVFQRSLLAAAELVEEQPQRIVTFGIRPTYPAESFRLHRTRASCRSPAGRTRSAGLSSAAVSREAPRAAGARVLGGGQLLLELRDLRLEGPDHSRRACRARAGDARAPGDDRRSDRNAAVSGDARARVRRHPRQVDRLRRDGACPRRAGHRSAVRVGRRGKLAGDCPAEQRRRAWQHCRKRST